MNKVILGTLNRGILLISILIAVMLIVSYVIAQNMSGPDAKVLDMINLISGGKVTGANPTAQNIHTTSAVVETQNIGGIESVPNECLGSALCPD
jgi:hypothetical protein